MLGELFGGKHPAKPLGGLWGVEEVVEVEEQVGEEVGEVLAF